MADNVDITPGSGATVAADEIGGALYQRMKPCVGGDGEAVDVSRGNPMPVEITSVMVALLAAIERLNTPMWIDPVTARLRVSLDAISGSHTLATVSTLSSLANLGGTRTDTIVFDQMMNNYANTVRPRIT